RDVAALPPIAWVGAAFTLFFARSIFASIAAAIAGIDPEHLTLRAIAITSLVAYLVIIIAIAALWIWRRAELRRAGFTLQPRDALTGLGGLLIAFPLIWAVTTATRWIAGFVSEAPPDELAHETLRMLDASPGGPWWWLVIVAVVIGAPIVEEVIYRGFLQSGIAAVVDNRWTAILITSALFAVAHIGAADWHALPGLFTLSLAFGILYERTGRLGVCIFAHAAFNALNIAMALLL
ncbi:MAG: CPBP family intramembrane glutamic endopeptidase, partial [Planctomycetota bacterium]|nr:CPBP family intramembrane glutamic endopeptidase [Planctomycetota bacterium]